jgi:hypothetical protein
VRGIVPLLAVCAGLAVASGSAAAEPGRPLLALVGNGTTESVAWLDGTSLEPLPGRRQVYVGLHDIPHAFSPDGWLLALGSGRTASVVVVDLRAMRLLGKLATRSTSALAWLSARRLLLIEYASGSPRARIILIGPHGLRTVSRWTLPAQTTTHVQRQAAWLGHGIVAVAGEDHRNEVGPAGLVQTTTPAGLRLVDTRTWSVRTLDEAAVSFTRSGGLLVGTSFGPGRLSVYEADGRLLSRSMLPPASGLQIAGARAYVTLGNEYRRHRVRVVDLRSGATLRTVRVPGWFFPLSRSSPQLCWC